MKLSIFYTNKCSIKCDHCFIGEQKKIYRMSDDMLEYVLSQNRNLAFGVISFTGGEPLMYWEDIRKSIQNNKLENVKITISTNAYWADSKENSDKMCMDLLDNGISQVEVSCDEYHCKYIPMKNTINLINSAKEAGLNVKVIMSVSNDLAYLSIYSKLIRYVVAKDIVIQHVALFGNAAKNAIDSKVEFEKFVGVRCDQLLNPCVMYNGDIFACCGPGIIMGKSSNLYLGNIRTESIENIMNKMYGSAFIQQIATEGPASLANKGNKIDSSSLCEFCLQCDKKMA